MKKNKTRRRRKEKREKGRRREEGEKRRIKGERGRVPLSLSAIYSFEGVLMELYLVAKVRALKWIFWWLQLSQEPQNRQRQTYTYSWSCFIQISVTLVATTRRYALWVEP
jgi:hypothetical protein